MKRNQISTTVVEKDLIKDPWTRLSQDISELPSEPKTKRSTKEGDIITWIKNHLKSDKEGKVTNVWEIISDPEILRQAYEKIKSKPGNMVPGTDQTTLDGISNKWFEVTSNEIINEKYSPKPARRVYIPKSNGKMRPLGIAPPRDKIVQQAILFVLTTIYEPLFLESSHGFRPDRSCHTALRQIREWRGVPWIIEGDIKSFFDNIDHHILENLLSKRIKDAKFIHLYWKLVKAGYVEWNSKDKSITISETGVPQGSIVSPILSNIILHEFDIFMDKHRIDLEEKNHKILPSIANPEYKKIESRVNHRLNRLKTLKSKSPRDWATIRKVSKELKFHISDRRKHKSRIPNPKFSYAIKYTRYADDWVVGVWGSRTHAVTLKGIISNFLATLKLELSIEKTLITNTRDSRIEFLGVGIKRVGNNQGATLVRKRTKDQKVLKYRIPTCQIWMSTPLKKILEKLKNKNLIKLAKVQNRENRTKPIAQSITWLIPLPVKDIILRYKAILNGFLNYYSFADDRPRLHLIYWVLKESLIKTLGRKLKTNRRSLFQKYSKDIMVKSSSSKGNSISFEYPDLTRQPMNFKVLTDNDPTGSIFWKVRTRNSFDSCCANCGSMENIEMHHIKHIKTINIKLSEFDKKVAAINRKQVPLCKPCHRTVHSGTYKGLSLNHLGTNRKKKA